MKRLILILSAIFAFAIVSAQEQRSIIIDANSFREIKTDVLTAIPIDPIGKDSSRRPCARIKVKIHRMTKDMIDGIEPKIHSNNELTKCKTADYDNGLILEMTAKPGSRFYLYHPEFGESNEVSLNLEENKEYYLEASLNHTYSIIVNSNVANVDVYIDDTYKGQTDASMSLTVKNVLIGAHKLKVSYSGINYEQNIEVNSDKIFFRQNVNTQVSKPQFVVFGVEPKTAVVTIDNRHYSLQNGAMQIVLERGSYNYTVSAAGYHSQSGRFTVEGEKIEKIITLKSDAANVTLKAPDGAEIWINGEKKGVNKWNGTLISGTYIFEARKDGHRPASISKNITSDNPSQSYTLPVPTPITGSLIITSTPIMAEIELDGKAVGRTPLNLYQVLVGEHTIKFSKSGYKNLTQTAVVSEGKTATINANLTESYSPSSKSQKSTTNNVRRFEQHVAVNTDIMFNDWGLIGGGTYTAGRRFNNYIFLGGGIGCSWYECFDSQYFYDYYNSSGIEYSSSGLAIPIFAKFRCYFTKTKVKPFFDLSFGMDILIEEWSQYHYRHNDTTGHIDYTFDGSSCYPAIHINPTLGLSIQLNNKLDMYLSTGFRYFGWEWIGLSLNLGFAF